MLCPQAKRKYGYFSLPVLIGDTFVARMDAKADRKNRMLIINNLHFESIKLTKPMLVKLGEAIKAYTLFNQCDAFFIQKSNNQPALKSIQKTNQKA